MVAHHGQELSKLVPDDLLCLDHGAHLRADEQGVGNGVSF